MENLQYSKILRKNWELIAMTVGLAIILALIISLVTPFQYSATTRVLIIQKQSQNLDPYTSTKSAELIGKNFANIIYTSSFYDEVIGADSSIQNRFPTDPIERKKAWTKNIEVNVTPESGMLEVIAYDTDRNSATELAKTISYVLVNKGAEYHGGGQDVEIKVVDDVSLSKYPVRPNILLNSAIAIIVGILLGSYWIILRESDKMQKSLESQNYVEPVFDEPEANQSRFSYGYVPAAKSFGFDVADANKPRTTRIVTMYDHLQ